MFREFKNRAIHWIALIVIIGGAGYAAGHVSEQNHQEQIHNQTEVRK